MAERCVVIGGGLIGAHTALALRDEGHPVRVFSRSLQRAKVGKGCEGLCRAMLLSRYSRRLLGCLKESSGLAVSEGFWREGLGGRRSASGHFRTGGLSRCVALGTGIRVNFGVWSGRRGVQFSCSDFRA